MGLYKRRERLDEASTLVRFGFLYQGYRPEYWGWEAVVMLRKVIAVAIVVYLNGDAQLQIEWTRILLVASVMLQVSYQPFVQTSHRLLETYSLVAIFLTLSLRRCRLRAASRRMPRSFFSLTLSCWWHSLPSPCCSCARVQ